MINLWAALPVCGTHTFHHTPTFFAIKWLVLSQERRKEGRTIHTKASKTSITIASIALSGGPVVGFVLCFYGQRPAVPRIFNAMAIAMPHWRSSWVVTTETWTPQKPGHRMTFIR